jgi:signal peptide peptidase-like protein 3
MQAIPGMLLALVLCFDHRKGREHENEGSFSRGNQYIRYAVCGYSIGLITALAAGLLSQLPQPALLYLVSSSWQLWNVLGFRTDEIFAQILSLYTAVK